MAELRPYPFAALITRMFRELEREQKIFDLPVAKSFFGDGQRDLSVSFHGHRASMPLGPAAGPQSQMAQNIVLAWLAGCRVMELKTVQVLDELPIPRPCIDMATIGYNVEWSQELKLEQSLEEYVKGSMLIEILAASGKLPLVEGAGDVIFDMSVGYDLAGIQTPTVRAFITGMKDATEVVERLRAQIPEEFAAYRALPFRTALSDTLTLSTFHGCPPDEIERIIEYLLREHGLHCIVKLNPTLLGAARARELLGEVMGYTDIAIPDSAFEKDAQWEQVAKFVERLGTLAASLGRSFGVKFSNTLLIRNHRDFFPREEKEMYMSGPPLHVLAMNLVRKFRAAFGSRFPISFSAGIDQTNFADAVAIGLVPVTVCSDLLLPGGYARASRYFKNLVRRMDAVGAATIGDFVICAYGLGAAALASIEVANTGVRTRCETALEAGDDLRAAAGDELHAAWVDATALLNTEHYVPLATEDPRYRQAKNAKPPRKVGSHLELFDCVTCNKCVPVCPNDANFVFVLPMLERDIVKVRRTGDGWTSRTDGTLVIAKKQQYANFADFCNECGNCDVFCPEDGGPYAIKPRFFGALDDWKEFSTHDGFALDGKGEHATLWGRIDGVELSLAPEQDRFRFTGPGFSLLVDPADPVGALEGTADGEADLTYFHILSWMRKAVYSTDQVNYLNSL